MAGRVGQSDHLCMSGERVLLIVEDNAAVSAAIGSYMSRHGRWEIVLTASDAGRGLMLASEHKPEAIVLDNRMPGGDGIEVLGACLLYTSPSPRDVEESRMPSSA